MRYIQDPKTLELVPADLYQSSHESSAPYVVGDIEPFQSHATSDRPIISSRSSLRNYCKQHGLVLEADCKGLPPTPLHTPHKRDREGVISAIKQAMEQRGY